MFRTAFYSQIIVSADTSSTIYTESAHWAAMGFMLLLVVLDWEKIQE